MIKLSQTSLENLCIAAVSCTDINGKLLALRPADVLLPGVIDQIPDGISGATAHPLDHIAKVCHEANKAYCEALGDMSQPTWENAPDWQRESARMGVDLHLMGNFGPEASHYAWMENKCNEGWKLGPVKDAEKKEHPCLVPFDQLPKEQQAKDFIFRAIVHAMKA